MLSLIILGFLLLGFLAFGIYSVVVARKSTGNLNKDTFRRLAIMSFVTSAFIIAVMIYLWMNKKKMSL
jgi:hypothetical protein